REFGITNAKAIVVEIPKELERKELNETLFTKAFELSTTLSYGSRAILTMKFASCDDDPGNSVNALPMGRRSGSRCIEFIIRPNFLTSNSR
uniref:hypothetical protein n=1 Tax=Leptospira noguchii TaxID=28182 RepID=UPI000AF299A3